MADTGIIFPGPPNNSAFIHKDEGVGVGFVIRRQDRSDYSPIGEGTLDLSIGDSDLIPRGITGAQSFGIGYNILGDGYASITSGWDIIANGNYSILAGISLDSHGGGTIMAGEALDNLGGDKLLIVGRANALPINNEFGIIIGNGEVSPVGPRALNATIRSNSLQIYRDTGVIELPSITIADIDAIVSKKVAITREWYESRNKYRFVEGTIHLAGQTTVALMNRQAVNLVTKANFEEYLTIQFTPDITDNYKIGTSFLWSLDNQKNKFLAILEMDDGINPPVETVFAIEPKDASGAGILVDVVAGGVIQPQVNTGTKSRHPETFIFNNTLQAGVTYTFRLIWGCETANLDATIYNAQIWVEQKTVI